MQNIKSKRNWRNFLIRNDCQLRIALHNIVLVIIVIGVTTVTALAPLYANFENPDNLWTQFISASIFRIIIERFMVVSIGILVFGFLYNIIITHRFCGPMVNFGKTFEKIIQGDLTRKIYLRPTDFLKNEANQVNEMIDTLSLNINSLKQYNYLTQKQLNDFVANNPGVVEDDQSILEIRKMLDNCENILSKFRATDV